MGVGVGVAAVRAQGGANPVVGLHREGGEAAGIARKAVEERTGVPVITAKNAVQFNQVVTDLLEDVPTEVLEETDN